MKYEWNNCPDHCCAWFDLSEQLKITVELEHSEENDDAIFVVSIYDSEFTQPEVIFWDRDMALAFAEAERNIDSYKSIH